jgi:hypothetical protein
MIQEASEAIKQAGSSTAAILLDASIIGLVVTNSFLLLREWVKMRQIRAEAEKAEAIAEKEEAKALATAASKTSNGSAARNPPCLSSPQMATIFSTQAVMKQGQDDMKALITEMSRVQIGQNEMLKQLVRSTNLLVRCAAKTEIKRGHDADADELLGATEKA